MTDGLKVDVVEVAEIIKDDIVTRDVVEGKYSMGTAHPTGVVGETCENRRGSAHSFGVLNPALVNAGLNGLRLGLG